jgi:hypothetical protein
MTDEKMDPQEELECLLIARRATRIGSELCHHLDEHYEHDDRFTQAFGALHAGTVLMLMEGYGVADIVDLVRDHAAVAELKYQQMRKDKLQ